MQRVLHQNLKIGVNVEMKLVRILVDLIILILAESQTIFWSNPVQESGPILVKIPAES